MTAKYFSGSPALVEAAAVLKAMADPNRLRMLDLLADRESCHAELKEKLGLPPNLLSHHLGVLREAGLVQTRPDTVDARWIYYRAEPAALGRWRRWLNSFLDEDRLQPRPALCGPEGQDKAEHWPQSEVPAEKPRRAVLFLCSGNSCRSQMAEAVVNTQLGDRWSAVSAGTEPASQVHPKAVDTLAEIGIEWRGHAAKQADLFRKVPFDLVITLCDRTRQRVPAWVKGSIHLGFPDPVQAEGTPEEVLGVFREVRDEVVRQIPAFLSEWEKTHPYQN
jgi:protein-tyrosine-phosphatase/DNA-binding transcriptional ArsR family regulator